MRLRASVGFDPPSTSIPPRELSTTVLPSIASALAVQHEMPAISLRQKTLFFTVAAVLPEA